MAQITKTATLVGMRFYGVRLRAGQVVDSETIGLKREPSNPHDMNAIAVHFGGIVVGHIDRRNAAMFAPLLDRGARWRVAPIIVREVERATLSLRITIEQEILEVSAPKPARGKIAGIYRITIRGFDAVYIGQARDINERIASHWRELKHGIHTNPALRTLWSERGGAAFDATIVETAPRDLDGNALSIWLQTREEAWIERQDAETGVFNFDTPAVVLTGAERTAARAQRLRTAEAAHTVRIRRSAIESRIEQLRQTTQANCGLLRDTRTRLQAASGIRGLLFASSKERSALSSLRAEAERLERVIAQLTRADERLCDELAALPPLPTHVRHRLRKVRSVNV